MRPVSSPLDRWFRTALLLLALAALLIALPARAETNIGFRTLSIPDGQGAAIEVGVWHPTAAPATAPIRGLGDEKVAAGGPLLGEHLPLVVMSHGNGGWFGGHHDTAEALAKAGFVVAALTHTGDNYKDQSRATDMANRPRQIHVVIDYMLKDWSEHGRLDENRVGAFGFSSGGFTVLAAAGGEPHLASTFPGHCLRHPGNFDCKLTARQPLPADVMHAAWVHDPRIKAVVSAAPALGFSFGRKGLKGVTAPLQLWKAADDEILPDPDYAEAVHRAMPRAHDYRVVAKARHFDFLTPCDDYARKNLPTLCNSDPAFDRTKFHQDFNAAVTAFFTAHLVAPKP
jgi:predicted dienelactone hydrolase